MSLSTPLVSVVIPVYNHEKYVEESILSVINQTYTNIEIIIIDDGSSDSSVQKVRDLVSNYLDKKIIFIAQKNQGAHNAINKGLELSKGDILTILNSDDYFDLSRIEKLVNRLQKDNGDLIFSYVHGIDDNGAPLHYSNPWRLWYDSVKLRSTSAPTIGFLLLGDNFAVSTGNMVFTRKLYKLLEGFRDFRLAHDLDFLIRALVHVEPILHQEFLLNYRIHLTNTIHSTAHLLDGEFSRIYETYLDTVSITPPANPMAPCHWYWPNTFAETYRDLRMWRGLRTSLLELETSLKDNSANKQVAIEQLGRKTNKKVTIISHELSQTGAPALVASLALSLKNQGNEVEIISLVDGPMRLHLENLNIVTKIIPLEILNHHKGSEVTENYILENSFETIIVNSVCAPVIVPLYNLSSQRKIFWYIHETTAPFSLIPDQKTKEILEELKNTKKINFWFGSDETRKHWEHYGFSGVTKYWSGFSKNRINRPVQKQIKNILTVGTFCPRKGSHYLIKAFSECVKNQTIPNDVTLTFVGLPSEANQPFVSDLLSYIRNNNLQDRIMLYKNVLPDQLQSFYIKSDLYIQTSVNECLPIALLEAITQGIPIITTDTDGCKEVIKNNLSGITTSIRSVEQLSKAIETIIAEPKNAFEMALRAQEDFIDMLSVEAAISKIEEEL